MIVTSGIYLEGKENITYGQTGCGMREKGVKDDCKVSILRRQTRIAIN